MPPSNETQEKAAKLINDFQEISFLKISLIVLITLLAIFLIRKTIPYLASRGPSQIRLYLLGAEPILRLIFLLGAILWLIPIIFNITLQNFFVIAGAASVAIGFALKDYASSLIAGIVAVFERPYRPGDWVEIEGDYGEVQAVGLRAISLRTPADDIVSIPHRCLWDKNISNSNDGSRTLMCIADFYLEPDHDASAMRRALHDVAITSAFLNYDKPVHVILQEKAWGTHYKLKAYPFDLRDQFAFISDMTSRGKKQIAALGVTQIAAPYAEQAEQPRGHSKSP